MNLISKLMFFWLGFLALSALYLLVDISVTKYQEDKAEAKCVQSYIARGYERKDIFTGNGECWYIRAVK